MYKIYTYNCTPYNCLAEEILLGTIIIHPSLFAQTSNLINSDSFFLECHQIIYRNFITLDKSTKLNLINLLYILHEKQILNHIGGVQKITEMMKQSQIFMSSKNISIYSEELADLIKKNHLKRLIIQYGYNIIQLAFIHKSPNSLIYNKASDYLDSIIRKTPKKQNESFEELVGKFLLRSTTKSVSATYSKHCIYGFNKLDCLTNGISNGDLIIIAGRPSMGKTSLAINIAYHNIYQNSIHLCIFSLEMPKEQIFNKLISVSSSISLDKITSNEIGDYEWHKIKMICSKLLNCNTEIYDKPDASIEYILYKCQYQLKNKKSIKMVIIDYLQLIQAEQVKSTTRAQELSYITRKLKILAQQLNIPIIVLSQLNRNIESRVSKLPLLSDLKESGCINNKELITTNISHELHVVYILYKQKINGLYKTNISKIYLSHKHNYKIQFISLQTAITNNHQILNKKKWLREERITENNLAFTNLYIINNNLKSRKINYVNSINFSGYSEVYDILIPKYRFFSSNNITVHNSIEQDADVVMILYKSSEEYTLETKESTTIDITLCKNRNGRTGLSKLLFFPYKTYFKDCNEDNSITIR